MFRRKLGIVFCIMLAFSLISLALVSAFGKKRPGRAEAGDGGELVVAASFYPVWVIVENVCAGVEGVRAVNLTQNHTGCLHDYQLTAADMLTLETADILVINGGDMELFVTEIVKKLPGLPVVDACRDISLLEGSGHSHEHEEAADGNRKSAEEASSAGNSKTGSVNVDGISSDRLRKTASAGADGISSGRSSEVPPLREEDEYGHAVNGHVWMDPARYEQQIRTVAAALAAADAEHAAQYAENAERYCGKVDALRQEYEEALTELRGTEAVLFHDAFYYLCAACGIAVLHSVDMDADTALSAGELAELADEIRYHGVTYLLADETGRAAAEQLAAETGAQVIDLNPLTDGDGRADSYLEGMRKNLEILSGLGR